MLSDDEKRAFATDGYLVVRDVVPEALLATVDAEIDRLVEEEPPPEATVGPYFWFLPPTRLAAADTALRDSGALTLAEELVAPLRVDHALDHIQIALNRPPYHHVPGAPHIDGHRPDEPVASFTMLAAIFLGDETEPGSGNLWVWPGSHLGHQALFRERGVDALTAASGHAVMLSPPVTFGAAVPVLAERGDLLLAHYLLGHNTGGNTGDAERRVVYYRLAAEGHAERWQSTFVDALAEYEPVRRASAMMPE